MYFHPFIQNNPILVLVDGMILVTRTEYMYIDDGIASSKLGYMYR